MRERGDVASRQIPFQSPVGYYLFRRCAAVRAHRACAETEEAHVLTPDDLERTRNAKRSAAIFGEER